MWHKACLQHFLKFIDTKLNHCYNNQKTVRAELQGGGRDRVANVHCSFLQSFIQLSFIHLSINSYGTRPLHQAPPPWRMAK
jgi:hypothetical protein